MTISLAGMFDDYFDKTGNLYLCTICYSIDLEINIHIDYLDEDLNQITGNLESTDVYAYVPKFAINYCVTDNYEKAHVNEILSFDDIRDELNNLLPKLVAFMKNTLTDDMLIVSEKHTLDMCNNIILNNEGFKDLIRTFYIDLFTRVSSTILQQIEKRYTEEIHQFINSKCGGTMQIRTSKDEMAPFLIVLNSLNL